MRKAISHRTFLPEKPCVVLGSSNKKELEVNEENCAAEGIEVFKRYGGGGTVVLYKDSLVVSVGCWVRSIYDNDKYFRLNERYNYLLFE